MNIIRWWNELRNPALKCARQGHRTVTRSRTGMVWSRYYVADSVVQELDYCPRCGHTHGPWREISRSGISSWTAPSEVMREFEKTGEYWRS